MPAEAPPDAIMAWALRMASRSAWFARAMAGIDPEREWALVPTMDRGDMQHRLDLIVPADEPLDRLVVNPTSGTTGHPIKAPNHPRAVACYDPMLSYVLGRYGVDGRKGPKGVSAIQLCDQLRTVTYYTVHSLIDGAGFAKINLQAGEWRDEGAPARYVEAMEPLFLSGDPWSFLGAAERGVGKGHGLAARILVSTAVALDAGTRRRVEAAFGLRAAQIYSLNETGPLGYECPANPGSYHVLPMDVWMETLDADGHRSKAGERGEICVTGGRNPYLPLLRYRTGDSAILDRTPCACGEKSPLLRDLGARRLVVFKRPDGGRVNPVDIARILRAYPLGVFSLKQADGLSCVLEYEALAPLDEDALRHDLEALFGAKGILSLRAGLDHRAGKVIPFSAPS